MNNIYELLKNDDFKSFLIFKDLKTRNNDLCSQFNTEIPFPTFVVVIKKIHVDTKAHIQKIQ